MEGTMNRITAFVMAFLALIPASVLAAAAEISAEGQMPGSKIIVTSVKRDSAGTVTLRLQLVNEGKQKVKTYGVLGDLFSLDAVTLVDTANKKKYLVVKDAEKKCVCSDFKEDLNPGTRFNVWAMYPAPPANVQKINVLVPGFEPVEAPITAGP
jgi:predicted secreted protein